MINKLLLLLKHQRVILFIMHNTLIISDFIEKYKLVIDQTTYKGEELLLKILELKDDEIQNVIIKKKLIVKTCIIIKRKN